jgi:hypothetical protein
MNEGKKLKTKLKSARATAPVVPLVMQDFFFVGGVEKEHDIDLFGRRQKLPLTWADGMIGVLPVFVSQEAAETYSAGKLQVYSVHVEKRVA